MTSIRELYRKNVYGVMGTLIFHILLIGGFWVTELKMNVKIDKEEAILLDFKMVEVKKEVPDKQIQEQPTKKTAFYQANKNNHESGSNQGVNDASTSKNVLKKDNFFDDSYKRDIEEAKKMVVDVNKQLSKKVVAAKRYDMPVATTEGQHPDSIKNVIYSGKSNIHYFLENRFHIKLPIPVYLARSGGEIKVDIQVDQSGNVIKAEARPGKYTSDPMLTEYATQAAERTVFNADKKAPSIQKGSITYKFVAQ